VQKYAQLFPNHKGSVNTTWETALPMRWIKNILYQLLTRTFIDKEISPMHTTTILYTSSALSTDLYIDICDFIIYNIVINC